MNSMKLEIPLLLTEAPRTLPGTREQNKYLLNLNESPWYSFVLFCFFCLFVILDLLNTLLCFMYFILKSELIAGAIHILS